MDFINTENAIFITCIARIYIIYYLCIKITNEVESGICRKVITYIILISIAIIYTVIRKISTFFNGLLCLIFMLAMVFGINIKSNIGYSLCTTIICSSINYILYFIAGCISYIIRNLFNISSNSNSYTSIIIFMIIYVLVVYLFSKIKRFKHGIAFLQKKIKDDYFDALILNISIIILFLIIMFSNYEIVVTANIGIAIILYSIIMFITIQKSIKLYYKQNLLIQDLNETKKELENKKKEVEELEKENLNFSKISHSIAHKQKALEYKLNNLMLKSETASEIDLQEQIQNIKKDLQQKVKVEIGKTNIEEIDDILAYMQAECIKNEIDFQLQISGNIYHMTNNYINKEKLSILLADLIKNAIIAISYSENINKSILVRLGIIDGYYSLYVYDSGIEFEPETLANLGKKPSTTHADNGGTGMGMVNTFDTLNEYKASIIINEIGKPCKNNFTKVIKIIFDKKNTFNVESYRTKAKENK